jgi:hypothetical protein
MYSFWESISPNGENSPKRERKKRCFWVKIWKKKHLLEFRAWRWWSGTGLHCLRTREAHWQCACVGRPTPSPSHLPSFLPSLPSLLLLLRRSISKVPNTASKPAFALQWISCSGERERERERERCGRDSIRPFRQQQQQHKKKRELLPYKRADQNCP